ncbi:hypothetical protein NMT12_90137 [metagenome]
MVDQTTDGKKNSRKSKMDSAKKSTLYLNWFQFVIAITVISAFLYLVFSILPQSKTFENSIQLISLVATFVGMIIGFYFGQKPVQELSSQVSDVTSEKKEVTKNLQVSDRLNMLNDSLVSKLETISELTTVSPGTSSKTGIPSNAHNMLLNDIKKIKEERENLKNLLKNRIDYFE